jgi:hypothetical protein
MKLIYYKRKSAPSPGRTKRELGRGRDMFLANIRNAGFEGAPHYAGVTRWIQRPASEILELGPRPTPICATCSIRDFKAGIRRRAMQKIPFGEIERIRFTSTRAKSPGGIMAETGADYGLNGGALLWHKAVAICGPTGTPMPKTLHHLGYCGTGGRTSTWGWCGG